MNLCEFSERGGEPPLIDGHAQRARRTTRMIRKRGGAAPGQGRRIVVQYPEGFKAGSTARGGSCTPRWKRRRNSYSHDRPPIFLPTTGVVTAERCSSRILKNPFSPRLLKKVQMQGGAPGTHPQDGCRCEAYLVRTPQRRASAPTPQMGLFQQPVRFPSRLRPG